MTKKEFKEALLRGLGRCVIAVQQEPEKYRDIVLWACKRNFAYDAQCEGIRTWYVYTMVCAYADKTPFIHAAAEALRNCRPRWYWDWMHLSNLLMFFALDGSSEARTVLEEKYQQLFSELLARKRKPNRMFHERSALEELGIVLAVDRTSFLRITKDFGRLHRETSYMEAGDFCWYFSDKGDRYRKTMERAAQKDADIACFLEREQAYWDELEAGQKQQRAEPDAPEGLTGVPLSRWLERKADRATVECYAETYRTETRPEQRAAALQAFWFCPYPGEPQVIIEDTRSSCERLRDVAWRTLENIRHPAVRTFALQNNASGCNTPENFALLVTNSVPGDAELLETLLRAQIAAKDWDNVHAAGMDVFRTLKENNGMPRLRQLLPLVYEYTPCACCREKAVRYLAKHRMLTKEMLEECLFDSNDDIRRYAQKRLKK